MHTQGANAAGDAVGLAAKELRALTEQLVQLVEALVNDVPAVELMCVCVYVCEWCIPSVGRGVDLHGLE